MHTSSPIVTFARLSIHTSSPIQERSPSERSQGYLTRTQGLMTTESPMRAPKIRSRMTLTRDEGNTLERSTGRPRKNQSACVTVDRPAWYQELSNVERSGLINGFRRWRVGVPLEPSRRRRTFDGLSQAIDIACAPRCGRFLRWFPDGRRKHLNIQRGQPRVLWALDELPSRIGVPRSRETGKRR